MELKRVSNEVRSCFFKVWIEGVKPSSLVNVLTGFGVFCWSALCIKLRLVSTSMVPCMRMVLCCFIWAEPEIFFPLRVMSFGGLKVIFR